MTDVKNIKYLNKDFSQFRKNLIDFAKIYFPDTYNDFNESSDWAIPEDESADITGLYNPLLEEDNLYSRLLVPTLGGKLPFIFQADGSNNSSDQFAICTIKKGSFKFQQKSHKRYNIKLTIIESW